MSRQNNGKAKGLRWKSDGYEMNLEEEMAAVKLYRARGMSLSLYSKNNKESKTGHSKTS